MASVLWSAEFSINIQPAAIIFTLRLAHTGKQALLNAIQWFWEVTHLLTCTDKESSIWSKSITRSHGRHHQSLSYQIVQSGAVWFSVSVHTEKLGRRCAFHSQNAPGDQKRALTWRFSKLKEFLRYTDRQTIRNHEQESEGEICRVIRKLILVAEGAVSGVVCAGGYFLTPSACFQWASLNTGVCRQACRPLFSQSWSHRAVQPVQTLCYYRAEAGGVFSAEAAQSNIQPTL